MPRQPCLFRKRDVKRAVEAVMSAGLGVAGVEIGKDGAIVVVPGKPDDDAGDEINLWDEVLGDATKQKRAS
jgi:hypothetical protein